MTDCEHLDGCPIFDYFRLESLRTVWTSQYCRGSLQESCARKIMKAKGWPVPANLLPNGHKLPDEPK